MKTLKTKEQKKTRKKYESNCHCAIKNENKY